MHAAGCVPFLQQILNPKAELRCSLAYFHWKRAPSREQTVHYIIISVSKTSLGNKNPTLSLPNSFIYWLGCSPNWASLARLLTQISGAARHARPATWVGLRRTFTPDWTPAYSSATSALSDIWTRRTSRASGYSAASRKGRERSAPTREPSSTNCLLSE